VLILKQSITGHLRERPLIQEQIARRQKRAAEEGFRIKNTGNKPVLSIFQVSKPEGKVYPVRIRSVTDRVNTCACPDYEDRKNKPHIPGHHQVEPIITAVEWDHLPSSRDSHLL
jgi:hypothetical protein